VPQVVSHLLSRLDYLLRSRQVYQLLNLLQNLRVFLLGNHPFSQPLSLSPAQQNNLVGNLQEFLLDSRQDNLLSNRIKNLPFSHFIDQAHSQLDIPADNPT
jgi:hypothetical protein